MNIQTGGKVSGVYGIKVLRNAGTDKEHLEDFGESPNMLLDGFFERFASGDLSFNSWLMFVGTGTTPVVATQTQLVSLVGRPTSVNAAVNNNVKVDSDYIASSTGVAEWPIGVIVGNISEVGIRLGSRRSSTVDSRALIIDSQGSPTTITVTAEDKLVVNYTLKYIIPIEQHVSVVDFAGTQTTCTLERVAVLDSNRNSLKTAFVQGFPGLIKGSHSQELINNPESTENSGTTYNIDITYSTPESLVRRTSYFLKTNSGNTSLGLKYVFIPASIGQYYPFMGVHFDPPIPKDTTNTLTLDFDYTLTRA